MAQATLPSIQPVSFDQTTPGTTNGVQVNAALPAGTALMGKVGIDQTTPGTTNGFNYAPGSSLLTRATVNISSATDTTIVTAGAGGVTVRVYRMFLMIAAADNLTFKSASTSLNGGVLTFTGVGTIVLDYAGDPWFVTAAAEAFVLTTSTTAQVSGVVYYIKS